MGKAWMTFPDGRKLTQEEWWAYLKDHPNCSQEIYLQYGKYGFNVHGVCMNPHRVIIYTKPGSLRYGDIASVSVCQSPCGAWTFACDATSNISSPHIAIDPTKPWCFKSANEAIYAGLLQLEKKLVQDQRWVEQMEVARRRRMDEEDDGDNAEEKNYNTARLQRIKKLLKGTREKRDYYEPRQRLLF